jgi:hypothetical protein
MPSRAKQLADEEAARAEVESPDGDEENGEGDETGAPQTDAPPEQPSDDPSVEDIAKFTREHERHAHELRAIMGDDFETLAECDFCGGMGYAPPQVLRTNDRYKMCDTCNGFGNVLTGSRIETSATAPCPACQGRGYLEKLSVPQPTGEHVAPQSNGADEYGTPTWMGSPDVQPQPVYGPPS